MTSVRHQVSTALSMEAFAVLAGGDPTGNLAYFEWMIVGDKAIELEFEDLQPKIVAVTSPKKETFKFEPEFHLAQEIDHKSPLHEIPDGMATKYDYDGQKLYFGKNITTFIGPNYFERHGEVKSPRFTNSTTKGRILSGAPKAGYIRYRMDRRYEVHGAPNTDLLVEIPPSN